MKTAFLLWMLEGNCRPPALFSRRVWERSLLCCALQNRFASPLTYKREGFYFWKQIYRSSLCKCMFCQEPSQNIVSDGFFLMSEKCTKIPLAIFFPNGCTYRETVNCASKRTLTYLLLFLELPILPVASRLII